MIRIYDNRIISFFKKAHRITRSWRGQCTSVVGNVIFKAYRDKLTTSFKQHSPMSLSLRMKKKLWCFFIFVIVILIFMISNENTIIQRLPFFDMMVTNDIKCYDEVTKEGLRDFNPKSGNWYCFCLSKVRKIGACNLYKIYIIYIKISLVLDYIRMIIFNLIYFHSYKFLQYR